ncbi:MAG: glycosyltransferase family 4 protein [Phycisphaerales bacterium]|jgi:glycosyltransferase involved in cell wall biosynthesis|nr:glycosyltransferase family 4 protein [Phycisphaerales bacterium]
MKIGVFVSVVAGQKGFESNVSGHIQVPLNGIEEFRKAGHDVHLITNEFGEDRSLPFCLADDLKVHLVTDSRNRGGILERTGNQGSGVRILQLLKQVKEIKKICKEQKFDVLHLFGFNRTAHLAGGLKLLGLKTPVVVTIFGTFFPERLSFLTKRLWKRIDAVVTATSFVKRNLEKEGIPTTQITHGVIRHINDEYEGPELGAPHRVLFWRDLTIDNGADVVIEAYEKLAPKYPEINFDFAVRQHWEPIKGIDKIAENHNNIHLYHFPYEEGITLPKLLLESICVVMPIRKMSIDPQLVIAETLAAGIPVIASNQRSNPEFIVEGETGLLVPLGDVEATTTALDEILSDLEKAAEMGRAAKEDIAARWNWDNYAEELIEAYEKVIR